MTSEVMNEFDPRHPHEPAEAPILDAEGRCLVCCRMEHDRLRPLLAAERAAKEAALAEVDRLGRDNVEMLSVLAEAKRRSNNPNGCTLVDFQNVWLEQKDAALAAAIRERDEASAEVEKLRTYNRTFEPLVERLTSERDEAKARILTTATHAASPLLDRIAELERERDAYDKELARLRDMHGHDETQIVQLTRERDEARQRAERLKDDLDTEKAMHAAWRKRAEECETSLMVKGGDVEWTTVKNASAHYARTPEAVVGTECVPAPACDAGACDIAFEAWREKRERETMMRLSNAGDDTSLSDAKFFWRSGWFAASAAAIRERDEARERLAQVEADAAAMREVLEQWFGFVEACLPYTKAGQESLQGRTKEALATNAGKPLLDKIADAPLEIAKTLRFKECQHGIKQHWHNNQLVTPLCDACVIAAVRAALADGGESTTKGENDVK